MECEILTGKWLENYKITIKDVYIHVLKKTLVKYFFQDFTFIFKKRFYTITAKVIFMFYFQFISEIVMIDNTF